MESQKKAVTFLESQYFDFMLNYLQNLSAS